MRDFTKLSTFHRIIFVILFIACSFQETFAQMQLEKLDRGVVAVSMGGTKVFVSWRWLGTEDDITFNLYRNGTKVNATPLTVANYTDNAGSTTASYTVTAIVNGVEQSPSAGVIPWAQQYLKVPITAPAGGTTPDGVAYTYNANDASIADLDGDGQWEIILKWDPSNSKDNSFSGNTGNTFIDAYKLNGTRLWRIDFGRNIRAGAHYLDFMVYDFDGDGKAEMMARTAEATKDGTGVYIGNANADYRNAGGYILTGPEYITVFNGQTGKAMATKNLYPPRGVVADWGDGYGNRVDRFKACVAYLDGQRPSAVFTRGYYAKWGAEAVDWRNGQLTTRWTFMVPNNTADPNYSEGAHSLSVADVDGDGKQEVITGSLILDDNGTVYYNTNIGHGDALHVSDLDPDLAGTEIMHIQEPVADAGLYMYSGKTKKVLWKKPTAAGSSEGPGRGVCADISTKYRGAESWVAGGGIAGVYDCKGNLTTLGNPQSCNFLAWWDGDVLRELLNNTMIDKFETGRLLTAYNIAPISSNNGTKSTPCLSGDIMGDWREEVIWRASANDALYIFTTTTPSTYKFRTLMSDPQYRVAIAWQNTGYNQPPHLSYYLGDGMATPAKPNIVLIPPANLATCSATITSPSNAICGSGTLILTANAGASYKWFNGTTQVGTASTYTATAAGSYTVEVTNAAGCKATSAVKTITANPLPVVTHYVQIGTGAWLTAATASVCEGNTVNLGPQPNLAAGWAWTGPNGFTSTLRNPVLTNITVANTGNYIATYTDPNGCKASSTFTLQVTKPTASITVPTTTIIPYAGSLTLNATTGTGYTYQWKRNNTDISGATTASYTATTAGSYTVTVTASTCSVTSAAVVLTVSPTPLKYIYNYDNSGNLSWTNTNSWTPKAVPTAIDTIIIRTGEAQINALTHTAPIYVEANGILRLVTANSTANKIYLQGGTLKVFTSTPELALSADIIVEQPSTIMAGSVAATIFTLNGTITGNANLTKTSVGILRINSTATSYKGNWIITDGKLQLRSASGLGVCGVQVKSPGRLDIEVAGASIYSLVVETGGGVDLDQPLATNVAVLGTTNILTGAYQNAAYPTFIGSTSTLNVSNSLVTLSGPSTFCTGSGLTLTANSGASYIWKNNTTQVGTAAAYTTNTSGSYTVDATSAAGCKVTSAPVATVGSTSIPPTINATATSFCPGGSATLTASTGASYKWFNGTTQVGTASIYTATTAGAYTVEVTNAAGCKATSAVTQISVSATPTASITAPATSFCPGGSVTLTASAGTSYKWFNGTTQVGTASTYTANTAGAYTVEVTIAAGCTATSSAVTITENTTAIATPTITASSTSMCAGGSVILASSSAATYRWFNGTNQIGSSSAYTVTAAGTYTVEVTNSSGCKATSAPIQISIGSTVTWYADGDNDGLGDITTTLNACTKPNGYVATAGDACPADAEKTTPGNCGCGNTEASCVSTATVNGTSANITVVPQPFDANTTITVENYGAIQSYTIISASGALVETRQGLNTTEITLGESIASGLYTVIITTEQGTYTTKIVKK